MKLKEHYHTIVVGAGPAGIAVALRAAACGSVLLAEANLLPRDKSCGGMLNEYSRSFFKAHGFEVPEKLFSFPRRLYFRYFDWDRDIRKKTSLEFANVVRKDFDEWMLGFLPGNVEVIDALRLVDCSQDHTKVTAHFVFSTSHDKKQPLQKLSVSCDYLIGCDGPRSTLRSCLPVSKLALYKTLQDFLPLTRQLEPCFDCLYTRSLGTEYGYGYVIPKGELACVGSVFFPQSSHNLSLHKKAVELYSSFYSYECSTQKREAWIAVQLRSVHDIVAGFGRILLAGEAAGIMSPSSGEGISFALHSGDLAGRALIEAASFGKRSSLNKAGANHAIIESEALKIYRSSLGPIKKNIARRLRYFPLMNSSVGKWLGPYLPPKLLDAFTHRI